MTQSNENQTKQSKTWKREIACALLVFWGYIVFDGNVNMVEVITLPVFLYTLGAFGMDAYSKQMK